MEKQLIEKIEKDAIEVRKAIIEMIGKLGIGHIGGCLSIADVLAVLYFGKMRIDPANPSWKERDRFVLSKGHAGPALYATLALRGYFDRSELDTLNRPGTNLPSHCDMKRTRGVDMTAGSLGQGFSAAVGMAIGAVMDQNPCRIYTIVGDGESQEGQIWEAAMLAGNRRLHNLTAFIDNNRMQIDGLTCEVNDIDPIADKWRAFKWNVLSVDGHNVKAIYDAISLAEQEKCKPTLIILNTVKGKGADFCEGQVASHNMPVTEEQWKKAVEILCGKAVQ